MNTRTVPTVDPELGGGEQRYYPVGRDTGILPPAHANKKRALVRRNKDPHHLAVQRTVSRPTVIQRPTAVKVISGVRSRLL